MSLRPGQAKGPSVSAGGGGGGGGGNLSGTLTVTKIPVASGANTLIDSSLSLDGSGNVLSNLQMYFQTTTRHKSVALAIAAALVAVDASLADWFTLTMTANATLSNPTNPLAGRYFQVRVRQDGTGNWTLAYGTKYRFPGTVAPVLSTVAATVDYLAFQYNEDDDKWDFVGGALNFLT